MSNSPALPGEPSSLSQLSGVWAAAITPRREAGPEVDLGAALEIVDFLNGFPLDGIALLGATGEFIHFDLPDRMKLASMAIKRSRKPMVVNASHSTYPGTLQLAEAALEAGARAVMVMPPYFFRYTQAAIVGFYEKLAADLRGTVIAYNLPFFTNPIEPETLTHLLESGAVMAVKDSSGSELSLRAALGVSTRARRRILIGNDALLAHGLRQGADGVISGVACMAPELILGMAAALRGGDDFATARWSSLLAECLSWLDRFPVPMGIKLACNERKLPGGLAAIPSTAAEREQHLAFQTWFADWLNRVRA
jgi:dihydrodipicolinate synthase/N-acetylneuraminate lyase